MRRPTASRRRVSRWQIGADASRGAITLRGRLEVGHAPLHGYESFGGSERSGMNTPATTFGSPPGEPSITTRPCLNECAKNSGNYPTASTPLIMACIDCWQHQSGRFGLVRTSAISTEPRPSVPGDSFLPTRAGVYVGATQVCCSWERRNNGAKSRIRQT